MNLTATNNRTNETIASKVERATSLIKRMKGLMGAAEIPENYALWIPKCNWIHTLFVTMPIDVVYLDQNLKVVDLQSNLKPWRVAAPRWSAKSVMEFRGGALAHLDLKMGDQITCG